ncbi:MAG: transposase [Bacilli bacterium]|nr:transposase [Bacilli bacterium]
MFSSYQEIYLNSKSEEFLIEKRLELVRLANEIGIKATARLYKCSKNTVKRWQRRYLVYGKKGLKDLSKAPKNSPRKLDKPTIDKINKIVSECESKNKYITSVNVQKKGNINNCSYETVNRYVKKAMSKKKKLRKDKSSNKSIDFKLKLKPFNIIQIDIKYLTDINALKPYFKNRNLPKYQITARDVCSGFPIIAYCDEKSVTYTKMFLEEVLYPFLKQIPYLDLRSIKIQTDNGKEFTNKDCKTYIKYKPIDSSFTIFIKNHFKKHKLIIPGHCTAQSEVESFHWIIERDCLAWEDIYDNNSLIEKTTDFINTFINKNRFNCDYTPLEKIKSYYSLKNIILPKPIIL